MIKKESGGHVVYSDSGKKLSRVYKSKGQAQKRLRQIEYFKHKGAGGSQPRSSSPHTSRGGKESIGHD